MGGFCRKNRRTKIQKKQHKPTLPYDTIENILSRLPVKSLLRFKYVSKHWYSIISDPKFARFHLYQWKNSDYKSILVYSYFMGDKRRNFAWLKLTNQSKSFFPTKSMMLKFPQKLYGPNHVLCSCDGLLLLRGYGESDNMCIWNPSTGAQTMFSCKYHISNNYDNTFGFCYDAFNDDYKFVVSINNICYALYSYKNNCWIEKEDHSLIEIWPQPGLFVQGALHWVAYESSKDKDVQAKQLRGKSLDCRSWKSDYMTYEYGICYFDPTDDKFKKLPKPTCVDINFKFRLVDLRGQLCLYRNTYDCTVVEIWMMKEYGDCNSWMKLLTIENVPVPSACFRVLPMCLTNKNHVVLGFHVPACCSTTVVYDPKKKKFGYQQKLTAGLCFDESLLLPSRIKQD